MKDDIPLSECIGCHEKVPYFKIYRVMFNKNFQRWVRTGRWSSLGNWCKTCADKRAEYLNEVQGRNA